MPLGLVYPIPGERSPEAFIEASFSISRPNLVSTMSQERLKIGHPCIGVALRRRVHEPDRLLSDF